MYFSRSSSQRELIRITFSVMLSTVRSFIGGIFTLLGSILSFLFSFYFDVVIWVKGEVAIGERKRHNCNGYGYELVGGVTLLYV